MNKKKMTKEDLLRELVEEKMKHRLFAQKVASELWGIGFGLQSISKILGVSEDEAYDILHLIGPIENFKGEDY